MRADDRVRALVLAARVRAEVDALEHERAQRAHGLGDLGALADVALPLGGLDEVVHEPVDAGPPDGPSRRISSCGRSSGARMP